jgi:hypothetical protein
MSRIVVVGSGVVGQATGKGFTKKGTVLATSMSIPKRSSGSGRRSAGDGLFRGEPV